MAFDYEGFIHEFATSFYLKSTNKNDFTKQLVALSETPMAYEDNDLLDYALTFLPLEDFYKKAEEKYAKDKTWSEQDYALQECVYWFKHSFFLWVNNPLCDICGVSLAQVHRICTDTNQSIFYL